MSRFIDLYVEQAVIGGIMSAAGRTDGVDMATDAIEGLTEDHFTATPHKVASAVLQTPQRVRGEDRPADVDQRPGTAWRAGKCRGIRLPG